MFDKVSKLFTEDAPRQPQDQAERVRLATCVVLVEAARVDEEFSEEEKVLILDRLRDRYGLSGDDADELMKSSRESRDASVDLWQFTNLINRQCGNDEKIEIVEEAWRVVAADGGIHGHESHYMRQLGTLLNLNHRQIIDAKVKVLDEFRAS